jgi:hypothetical protein
MRKSTDSGATWTTVNDYNLVAGRNASIKAVSVYSSGTVYAAGFANDASNVGHWILRKSTDSGATWSTVSDYNLAGGKNANANAIGVDSSGNVYATGYAYDASNVAHWIVRKSTDSGATWTTVSDYNLAAGKTSSAVALSVDSSGNIYAAGFPSDASNVGHWIVRKSTDSGATWTTVSDYNLAAGKTSSAAALSVDSSGNTYAAGSANDTSNVIHWIVRKSTDSGATWATVSDYNLVAAFSAGATALSVDSSGNIYAAGYAIDASGICHWIVRKSTDSGATWTTVSDFNLIAGQDAHANALTVDSSGNIYAAGNAIGASGVPHWIVRKSTDSGATWTTISDYNLVAGRGASATALSVDSVGNIYAAGYAADASYVTHWIVRKSTDSGATWTTVSDYNLAAGVSATASALSIDSIGNIYAAGNAIDASSVSHWIVRKSSDSGATWTTIDDKPGLSAFTATANAIVPCLTQRICVAGIIASDPTKAPSFQVRILSQ